MAALIAWMLVVRVDDLVKDGAKRRRLRRSSILDKIINTNRMPSKRSRPLSRRTYNEFTPPALVLRRLNHAPSNCKIYKPALESVTYIRACASTKQSHDWIT